MKIHRYYMPTEELKHDFWINDATVLAQWVKVLRYAARQQVVLFDGERHDRLYEVTEISEHGAHVKQITDFERQVPSKELYLFWSLLKSDKNDWVLQKGTELGVSHFVPLLAERCDRTGFSTVKMERWEKIVVEAAEQCGRSDIPAIREAMKPETALTDYKNLDLFVCEQGSQHTEVEADSKPLGVFVGPEGGWSETEKELFNEAKIKTLHLNQFTLRAETAAITASALMLQ